MEYHKHIYQAFISPGLKDILNNDEDNFDCFIFQAVSNYHNRCHNSHTIDVTIHTQSMSQFILFFFSVRGKRLYSI